MEDEDDVDTAERQSTEVTHRQRPSIYGESNPLESGVAIKPMAKVENLVDAKLITDDQFKLLFDKLKAARFSI